MHKMIVGAIALQAIFTSATLADSQPTGSSGYQCPTGYKQIAHVCITPDEQHARCLYPVTVGAPPKEGTTSQVNPAGCPRHPPH